MWADLLVRRIHFIKVNFTTSIRAFTILERVCTRITSDWLAKVKFLRLQTISTFWAGNVSSPIFACFALNSISDLQSIDMVIRLVTNWIGANSKGVLFRAALTLNLSESLKY